MSLKVKYGVIIGLVIGLFLLSIYVYRINIYQPININLSESIINDNTQPEVYAITTLGKEIKIEPLHDTSLFVADFGYFNKIKIFNVTDISLIEIYDSNTQESYDFIGEELNDKIIISGVGKKNVKEIIYRIIELNSTLIIVLGIIIFLIFIMIYNNNLVNRIAVYSGLSFIIIIPISLLLIASYFSYPNAEDLALVLPTQYMSKFKAAFNISLSYDSRYITNTMYMFSWLSWGGVDYYKLSAITSLLMIIASLSLLIKQLFYNYLTNIKALIISLLLVVLHFAVIPNIAHDLYWMACSFVYLRAWVAIFLWISFILMCFRADKPRAKIIYFVLSMTSLFLSFGICELNIFINVYILSIITYYIFAFKKTYKHEAYAMWILSLGCIIFILLLPGMSCRMNTESYDTSISYYIHSIVQSPLLFFKAFAFLTVKNILIIPAGFTMIAILNFTKKDIFIKFSLRELILAGISCIFIMYICFVSFNVFSGADEIEIDGRILNYLQWLHMSLFIFILPAIITKIGSVKRLYKKINVYKALIVFIMIVCFSGLVGYNNYTQIYHEYKSGTYACFKKQMEERYSLLENSSETDSKKKIVIEEIHPIPNTIFSTPDLFLIKENANIYWGNVYKAYFKSYDFELEYKKDDRNFENN